jgi:lipopolysaccharide transport system permease protein
MAVDLRDSRELAWRLAWRNLDILYRNSMLGYLWLVLPPAITSALFIALHSSGSFAAPASALPYPLFAISSLLLWQCFADGFLAPLRMLRQNLTLLPKLRIPGEALVLAALLESLLQAAVRGCLILAILAFFQIPWPLTLWIAAPALAGLVFVGFSIGIAVAPAAALLPDAERAITLALPLWMLASGVVTPVPELGAWSSWLAWNPAVPILHFTQLCFLSPTALNSLPSPVAVISVLGIASFGSVASLALYRISLPHLAARIPV